MPGKDTLLSYMVLVGAMLVPISASFWLATMLTVLVEKRFMRGEKKLPHLFRVPMWFIFICGIVLAFVFMRPFVRGSAGWEVVGFVVLTALEGITIWCYRIIMRTFQAARSR